MIKLHRHSGKVSYLVYPGFDTDAHPALLRNIKLSLRTRELDCFDYARSTNPPVLHRKDAFLPADHPLHGEVRPADARKKKSTACSTTRPPSAPASGWEHRLKDRGFLIRGHRLMRRRKADHGVCENH